MRKQTGKRDFEWECENNRWRCDFSREIFHGVKFSPVENSRFVISEVYPKKKKKKREVKAIAEARVYTNFLFHFGRLDTRSQSLPGETGNTLYIACLSKRMCI